MIAETIVHIWELKLKIDWLGNKLWSFEIKVLKFHQKSGQPLVSILYEHGLQAEPSIPCCHGFLHVCMVIASMPGLSWTQPLQSACLLPCLPQCQAAVPDSTGPLPPTAAAHSCPAGPSLQIARHRLLHRHCMPPPKVSLQYCLDCGIFICSFFFPKTPVKSTKIPETYQCSAYHCSETKNIMFSVDDSGAPGGVWWH